MLLPCMRNFREAKNNFIDIDLNQAFSTIWFFEKFNKKTTPALELSLVEETRRAST